MAETYKSAYTGAQIDRAIGKALTEIDANAEDIEELNGDIEELNTTKADKTQLSNRNLLDNPWFTVNQRDVTTWSNGYGCDRFKASSATNFTWSENGVLISNAYDSLIQPLEDKLLSSIDGKTVTFSAMRSDGKIYSKTFVYHLASDCNFDCGEDSVYLGINTNKLAILNPRGTASANKIWRAVKLEVGSISTLHLDAPPNYAEELLKCQRYFYRLPTLNNTTYSAEQFIAKGSYLIGCVSFPVTMRNSPTITGLESIRRTSTGEIVPINIGYRHHSKSALGLFYGVGGLVEGEPYSLYATPYIDFSADL